MYIPHILGILPPTRACARGAAPASPSERAFEKTNALSKTEHTSLSACRTPPVEPARSPQRPGTGTPSMSYGLPSRPRCPSEALRAILRRFQPLVSTRHWSGSSDPSDWLTAPQGPLTDTQHVEARQDTRRRSHEQPFTPVVVTSPGVAILTALTRQKSQPNKPFSTAKEIGCYQRRGGGRGCDPARPSSPKTS